MKILIAEDQAIDRLLLRAAVRKLGHECLVANDGGAAWDLVRAEGPDVVISDWYMPAMDGTELCRRIRSAESRHLRASASSSYTPFIFVSGLDDREHVLAAMTVGADDFLSKPVDVDELQARLIAARRLKRAEEERVELLERERNARHDAERAIVARDQVLSGVSHDLRSPLASILGRLKLLRYRIDMDGIDASPVVITELERINSTATRMAGWLDELTDVAVLHDGQPLALQLDRMDLVALLQHIVGDSQSTTHSVEFESASSAFLGSWDRRLERVFSNVLGNAIKYSPPGSVRVILTTEHGVDNTWVIVQVIDHGVGIPAADLPRVFDPFFRASNAHAMALGSGIGLAGARQIVEQHGGSVTLDSTVGVGTTCTVRLPIDN